MIQMQENGCVKFLEYGCVKLLEYTNNEQIVEVKCKTNMCIYGDKVGSG